MGGSRRPAVETTPVKTGRSWVAVTTQVWYATTVPMLSPSTSTI
jgi:hypothetical protein